MTGVGCFIGIPKEACKRRIKRASRAAELSATISASADDCATDFWRADFHITAAPCIMVTRPLVDCRVSMQPAQSESLKVMTWWERLVWYRRPRWRVQYRYCMVRMATASWAELGLFRWRASWCATAETSGLHCVAAKLMQPTICRYLLESGFVSA